MYTVCRLMDRATVRDFLGQDRGLTAYALGDLDDALWPESIFYGAYRGEELSAVLLLYRGFDPAVLTAFGLGAGIEAILAAIDRPHEVYYLWLPQHASLLDRYYERPAAHEEWRLVLDPGKFSAPELDGVKPIFPEQAGDLAQLYRRAAVPGEEVVAFSPAQIARGAFFGVWDGGRLVSAAGTHVWSPQEGVAAIGNVFTHPHYRGQGFATRCTAAVARAALENGIGTIVLNVRCDNAPALRVYEKLGFHRYGRFLEGPAQKRL